MKHFGLPVLHEICYLHAIESASGSQNLIVPEYKIVAALSYVQVPVSETQSTVTFFLTSCKKISTVSLWKIRYLFCSFWMDFSTEVLVKVQVFFMILLVIFSSLSMNLSTIFNACCVNAYIPLLKSYQVIPSHIDDHLQWP